MKTSASPSCAISHYHMKARHCASDLELFKAKSTFFHHLLEQYAVNLSPSADLENLNQLGEQLRVLDEKRQRIEVLVHQQLKLIALVAENMARENLEKIGTTQTPLEFLMDIFSKQYRELKTKLLHTVGNEIENVVVNE